MTPFCRIIRLPPVHGKTTRPETQLPEALIQRHQKGLWRFARFLGAAPTLADDLVQEGFLALLARSPQVEDDSALGRWLRGVVHKLYVTHLRREALAQHWLKGLASSAVEAGWQDLAGTSDGDAYLSALDHCCSLLSPKEAELVSLRYRDSASRSMIAARLSLSEEGVKTLLRRVKERLRNCVQRRMETEHVGPRGREVLR